MPDVWHTSLVLAHTVGFVLGVGGATVSDVLFFKFLKDLKISHTESETLDAVSRVIWLGLVVVIVSGIGLYLMDAERLNDSSKFLTKMVVVAVIAVNGLALNLKVSPRVRRISFEMHHRHVSGELRTLRRIAFALGAVSIVSWYAALFLGAMRGLPFGATSLLTVYALIVVGAISVSQVAEHLISKKKLRP